MSVLKRLPSFKIFLHKWVAVFVWAYTDLWSAFYCVCWLCYKVYVERMVYSKVIMNIPLFFCISWTISSFHVLHPNICMHFMVSPSVPHFIHFILLDLTAPTMLGLAYKLWSFSSKSVGLLYCGLDIRGIVWFVADWVGPTQLLILDR